MSEVTYEGRPAEHDLYIVRGDTWQQDFIYESPADTPVDLTGYSARLQVRKARFSDSTLLALSSDDGDITLDDEGNIQVTATAAVTALLDFSTARYDLELTSAGGIVTTLLEGEVRLIKDVTR